MISRRLDRRVLGIVIGALATMGASGLALAQQPARAQPPVPAQPESVQRIAAVVNNDIISSNELAHRIDLALLVSGLPGDAETRRRLAPQVLRGLIDERLQVQAAERLRLPVTDAEIDRAFGDVARRNNMDSAQLARYLQERGIDPGLVRAQLKAQIAWLKTVGRELRSKVAVSRDQVDLALQAGSGPTEEVLLSEILIPVYDRDNERQVLSQANDLLRSIESGVDFAALARQISAAPSAETGGDLGWVRLSSIAPELRDVVGRMRPGQVSDPIRTPSGVHIIGMRDRRRAAETAGLTEGERETVRQQLQEEQLQRLAARYLRELRRSAFIDVRL
jgi:peptidyl-prolyl cis-trans isomerase SurA